MQECSDLVSPASLTNPPTVLRGPGGLVRDDRRMWTATEPGTEIMEAWSKQLNVSENVSRCPGDDSHSPAGALIPRHGDL